jgi:UDP-N-acetylmuramoyl-tripeptide--D-alanyl-D-alanine ligase
MGKTTTKEILAALVSARLRVLKSEGNLNNEFGAPLTLLRLGEDHDAAVLELGMSRRGELARLAEITQPEIGVVTNVAPVHLEFFASLDEIALAKRELIEGLRGPESVAVLNADDPRVSAFRSSAPGRVFSFGLSPAADFRAEAIEDRGALGSCFDAVTPAGRARVEFPLPGRHNLSNALAALAAASPWGIGAPEAREVFASLRPAPLRGEVLRFEPGFALINDCYNSSPEALAAALTLLVATPGFQRRVVVAGEMLELGPTGPGLHREAGHRAAALADFVFGVRGLAAQIVSGAAEAGLPEANTRFFESSEAAAEFLSRFIRSGDLVLVKGSRGVKMESIAETLKAHFTLRPAVPAAAPAGHH